MKIAIYGSRHQDDYINEIVSAVIQMADNGFDLIFHHKIADYLLSKPLNTNVSQIISSGRLEEDEDFSADLAMSIGGDGTFLRTAQWIGDKETPIVGVNTGHLGFLAPFTVEEAAEAAEMFHKGLTSILDRGLIRVDAASGLESLWPYALNEVALLKKDSASMITVDAKINRAQLAQYKCDGLIVATPTGSTGYNLSVGGPIVEPGSPSRIISPIAAHSLTMRPLVVSSDSLIELRVSSRTPAFRVSLDGRSVTFPCGSSIYLTKGDFVVKSVCKPDLNFYSTLRQKLLWGAN